MLQYTIWHGRKCCCLHMPALWQFMVRECCTIWVSTSDNMTPKARWSLTCERFMTVYGAKVLHHMSINLLDICQVALRNMTLRARWLLTYARFMTVYGAKMLYHMGIHSLYIFNNFHILLFTYAVVCWLVEKTKTNIMFLRLYVIPTINQKVILSLNVKLDSIMWLWKFTH